MALQEGTQQEAAWAREQAKHGFHILTTGTPSIPAGIKYSWLIPANGAVTASFKNDRGYDAAAQTITALQFNVPIPGLFHTITSVTGTIIAVIAGESVPA